MSTGANVTVSSVRVRDIRFPTSDHADGSDAMHKDPDYSCVYVELLTERPDLVGVGFTFTLGRGNEVVASAARSLLALPGLVVGRSLSSVTADMGSYWRQVVSDSQLRWIGPEKGAVHLAAAAVVNAWWDLWAKVEGKPLWKLLCDLSPEELVRCVDWRYLTDALTPAEAVELLTKMQPGRAQREKEMLEKGYPTYTTSAGWLGYPDDKIRALTRAALADGWNHIKIKVGRNLEDDIRRLRIIREEIGPERKLMVDANQVWDVPQAIEWMMQLLPFRPHWIEEPTSPDDVLGHQAVARALGPHGVGVATGEHCQNRVVFKQLLQANAISFCQIDACRLGGVNECVAVILLCAKFGVPVCPHAGGVGLCELVQHLSLFDYIVVSGSTENRVVEYVDHLHEHFHFPCVVRNSNYMPPAAPGYSSDMKEESLSAHEFPHGAVWAAKATA